MKKHISDSSSLALNRIFKSIADSAIKVFIPILIYKNTGSVFYAFLYLTLSFVFISLLYQAIKNFLKKHAALTITLHAIPIIVMEFLLLIDLNIWLIILIALLEAIQSVFYYSIKYIYAYMDKKNNVAKFETAEYIGKIIFVIISAIMLDNVANSLTFIVIFSTVFYILSSLPILFKIKELDSILPKTEKLSFREVRKDNRYWNIFHIFNGIVHMFMHNILPLYLYIYSLSYTKVGFVVILQYLITILANYTAMFLEKKGHGKLNVILGSILGFVSMILIITLKTPVLIYSFSVTASFGFTLIFSFMFHEFVKDQRAKGYYENSVFYRDSYQTFARGAVASVFLIFPSFIVMFVIGIVSNFLCGPTALLALKKYDVQKPEEEGTTAPVSDKEESNEEKSTN